MEMYNSWGFFMHSFQMKQIKLPLSLGEVKWFANVNSLAFFSFMLQPQMVKYFIGIWFDKPTQVEYFCEVKEQDLTVFFICCQ